MRGRDNMQSYFLFYKGTDSKQQISKFNPTSHAKQLVADGEFKLNDNQIDCSSEKKCDETRPCIYIESMKSHVKGRGFGTAVMREAIQMSLERGYEGRVQLEVLHESHLFYLYMGMLPIDRYSTMCDDPECEKVYQYLNEHDKPEDYEKDTFNIRVLKSLLKQIKPEQTSFSASDIVEQREQLVGLFQQKNSSLKNEFIPQLLDMMQATTDTLYPATSVLGQQSMILSDVGLERWKEAIAKQQQFVPFKRLEHIRPYMSKAQQHQLDTLLERRLPLSRIREQEKMVRDLLTLFGDYIERRKNEHSMSGYSEDDYQLRKQIYDALNTESENSKRLSMITAALSQKRITGGWRQECAGYLRSLQTVVTEIIAIEKETQPAPRL